MTDGRSRRAASRPGRGPVSSGGAPPVSGTPGCRIPPGLVRIEPCPGPHGNAAVGLAAPQDFPFGLEPMIHLMPLWPTALLPDLIGALSDLVMANRTAARFAGFRIRPVAIVGAPVCHFRPPPFGKPVGFVSVFARPVPDHRTLRNVPIA